MVFDYPINFSNGTGVNGVGDFFKYINSSVNNQLGNAIILLIWIVMFGLSMVMGTKRAILTASFISFIFSVFLFQLGMVKGLVPIILLALTILGLIGTKEDKGY